jgi:protein TonB
LTVIPFGEGMTRPSLLSKVDPAYTREAIEAKVEGLMLVKCVITKQGALQRCRVVKGLPHMNDAVLTALASWRFTPITYQGQPVDVDYTIPVRLVMP